MRARFFALGVVTLLTAGGVYLGVGVQAQDAPPDEPPPVPKGVEVMARGPIHEAFATPTAEAVATKPVPKQPPKPLDEMPPAEKPEGDVTWVGGYWQWDDERTDFIWVSGIWRTIPRGRQWVAGYWRETNEGWQWVPGFWAQAAQQQGTNDVTYLPPPPAAPAVQSPGDPPAQDTFYIPGNWVWLGDHYAWQPGRWARVVPGWVWVPAHFRWTPSGYIYVAGYYDLPVSRRGVLYAPVIVDRGVVEVGFVYTPAYAVSDTIVLDSMFVRPSYCHYYFGDYYGPAYHNCGYETVYVYSRRHYDSIVVYEHYEHRHEPNWIDLRIDIGSRRDRGELPVPPRTLVQQNTIIQQTIVNQNNVNVVNQTNVNNVANVKNTTVNNTVLMPTSKLAAARGTKTVPVDTQTRQQAREQSQAVQQFTVQRQQSEVAVPGGALDRPRSVALKAPPTAPVGASTTAARAPGTGLPASGSRTMSGTAGAGSVPAATVSRPATSGASNVGRSGTTSATGTPGFAPAIPARPGITGAAGTTPTGPPHPGVPGAPPGPSSYGTTPPPTTRPGVGAPGSPAPGTGAGATQTPTGTRPPTGMQPPSGAKPGTQPPSGQRPTNNNPPPKDKDKKKDPRDPA
jgi:hypothetical protein